MKPRIMQPDQVQAADFEAGRQVALEEEAKAVEVEFNADRWADLAATSKKAPEHVDDDVWQELREAAVGLAATTKANAKVARSNANYLGRQARIKPSERKAQRRRFFHFEPAAGQAGGYVVDRELEYISLKRRLLNLRREVGAKKPSDQQANTLRSLQAQLAVCDHGHQFAVDALDRLDGVNRAAKRAPTRPKHSNAPRRSVPARKRGRKA